MKIFERPEIEFVYLDGTDIITASGCTEPGETTPYCVDDESA